MHKFEIWAPLASKVSVKVDESIRPMQGPDEQGWWRLDVAEAVAGTDYGFAVDDDPTAYPDPRSLWQPQGVHGFSRVYEHRQFSWSDLDFQPRPLSSALIYELHVGTFTPEATLDSAIGKLDYLAELGVTHIELMPVAAFAGNHGWGYDGVALFAVHQPYGGPDALKRFVDAAHSRGMAVLLDVVYNHFGPTGNYTGKFGPYITNAHHTPWGGAVNLEGEWSHVVRRFFCDNALMWMRDFHIDGLRLDAVHAYVDRSAIHFLQQLAVETEALEAFLGRTKVLIAESDSNDPRIVMPREAGGFGIDAQWSDDFHHALFAALYPGHAGGYYSDFGTLDDLATSLEKTFVYAGIFSSHRQRFHGLAPQGLSQHRFLGYIQNHDQVGNRAVGERIHESVGFNRAMIAAAIVILGPFVPMIFQGEEWAASSPFQYFADHEDPELARLVSEGRKKEFQAFGWSPDSIPDPEKPETYTRSKMNWKEHSQGQPAQMLKSYKQLLRLRRSVPSLNIGEPGNTKIDFDDNDKWFRMERGEILLLCNLGTEPHDFEVPESASIVLSSQADAIIREAMVTVSSDSILIVCGK